MAKRGRATRVTLIILMIIFLLGAGFCAYLYFTQSTKEEKQVTMYLDTFDGEFDVRPDGYMLDRVTGNYYTLVTVGDTFGELPTPTRTGYVFAGWKYDSFASTTIKPNDVIELEGDFTLVAQWETEVMTDYVINFLDENGNEIADPVVQSAPNRTEVTIEDIPQIDGYTFNAEESELTQIIGAGTEFNLYYTANTYHIRYSIVSRGIEYSELTTFKYGENISLLSISTIQSHDSRFVLSGQVFDYWSLENGQQLQDGASITKDIMASLGFSLNFEVDANDTITLDAVYKAETFVATFMVQGEEYQTSEYEYNAFLTEPTAPNIAGYIFQGWYTVDTGATGTSISGLTAVNFYTFRMPNTALTLYAGFRLQEYNLTLILGDGGYYESGVSNPAIYTIESDFVLNKPVKDGFEFYGWWGMDIPETSPVEDLHIVDMTGNRTYYAMFGIARYEIQYELNGGTLPAGTMNPSWYNMESDPITLVNPEKQGYRFEGWVGTGLDDVTETVVIPTESFGDRTYTARFTPIHYNIEYVLNGGQFDIQPQDTFTVEDSTFIVATPTKQGYTFAGWVFNGEPAKVTLIFEPSQHFDDVTFEATWTLVDYNITYDLGGGTLPDGESNPLSYNAETDSFTLVNPIRNGYNFLGWTGSNGDEPQLTVTIDKNSSFEDLNFIANWETIDYEISYNLDGGTYQGNLPTSYNIESGDISIPNLTKDGYNFDGWITQEGEEPVVDYVITTGHYGDITLTAVFSLVAYNITLDLTYGGIFQGGQLPSDWEKGLVFTYTIETPTFNLPIPTNTGYGFAGWVEFDPENTTEIIGTATVLVTIEQGTKGDKLYKALWQMGVYSISYDLDGGHWGENPVNPATYRVTDDNITPSEPIKTGYTFTGWKLYDETGGLLSGETILTGSQGNRAYVATWSPNNNTPYYINYYYMNIDGGGYTLHNSVRRTGTTDTLVFESATEVAGFTLQESALSATIAGDGSTTIDFYYDRNKYTVSVDINLARGLTINGAGEYYYEQSVTLNAITLAGYNFNGYYNDEDQVLQSNANYTFSMGADNITIYARGSIISFNIVYNVAEGAEFAVENPTTYTVETPTFTLNNPTLEGTNFVGWTGTGLSGRVMNVTINQGTIGDRTYTANFEDIRYAITYDFAGGVGASGGYYPTSYTRADEIAPTAPTRAGYDFAGWKLTDAQGEELDVSYIEVGSTGERKFTALWTARNDTPYTVNIYLMQADGTYPSTPNESNNYEGTTDAPIVIELQDYDGYVTPTLGNYTINGDGSTVVEIRYARVAYHVTINYDDGIMSVTGEQDYYWGQTVNITATPNDGYNFANWTQTDGPTVLDNATTSGYSFEMPIGNVTLMANSQVITYTITYTLNGGSYDGGIDPNPTEYTILSDDIRIVNPSRLGYVFTGWSGTGLSELTTDLVITKGSTGNRTYTANFQATNVDYKVIIYQMGVDGESYAKVQEDTLQALTDSEVTPSIPTYIGFTTPDLQTKTISADGSTVFEYYYIRNQYGVSLAESRGIQSLTGNGLYYFGAEVTITAVLKDYYNFEGWLSNEEIVSMNLSYTFTIGAQEYVFTANTSGYIFNISYDKNTADVVTGIENLPTTFEYGNTTIMGLGGVERNGYHFMGWQIVGAEDKRSGYTLTIGETYHEDITLKAHWGVETTYFSFGLLEDNTLAIGRNTQTTLPRDVEIPAYVQLPIVHEEESGTLTILAYIVDQEFYENGNENTFPVSTIRGGTYNNGSYTIPSYSFANNQYYYSDIDTVTLPSTITTIGVAAFYNSTIKSISMYNSVTTISPVAFAYCKNMTSIEIPNSVTEISDYAFVNSGLTSIILSEGLQKINQGAFRHTHIKTLNLPSSLKEIGQGAFRGIGELENVIFAENSTVTTLGQTAFAYCYNLKTINIPNSVTSIGGYVFSYCLSLYDVGLSSDSQVTSIGEYAFQECISLTHITLPSTCTNLGQYVFNLCHNLMQVESPNDLSSWSGLTLSVEELERLEWGNASSFTGTLSTLDNGVVIWTKKQATGNDRVVLVRYIGDNADLDLSTNTNITMIGQYAFYEDIHIESVILPDSVLEVQKYAFAQANNLQSVMWPYKSGSSYTLNTSMIYQSYKLVQLGLPLDLSTIDWENDGELMISSVGLEIIDTSKTTTFTNSFGVVGDFKTVTIASGDYAGTYLYKYNGTNSTVDLTTQEYKPYAGLFFNNSVIKDVIFPSDMTEIPNAMFAYNFNLINIELPNTIIRIGEFAFAGNNNLQSINWEDLTNLTEIGRNAFDLNTSLEEIVINGNIKTINVYTFRGCFEVDDVTLSEGVERIEAYAFQSVALPNDFTIPESVVYIDENAFSQATQNGADYTPPFIGDKPTTSALDDTVDNVFTLTKVENDNDQNQNFNLGLIKGLFVGN